MQSIALSPVLQRLTSFEGSRGPGKPPASRSTYLPDDMACQIGSAIQSRVFPVNSSYTTKAGCQQRQILALRTAHPELHREPHALLPLNLDTNHIPLSSAVQKMPRDQPAPPQKRHAHIMNSPQTDHHPKSPRLRDRHARKIHHSQLKQPRQVPVPVPILLALPRTLEARRHLLRMRGHRLTHRRAIHLLPLRVAHFHCRATRHLRDAAPITLHRRSRRLWRSHLRRRSLAAVHG